MIKQAFTQGAVDTLLVSEGLRENIIQMQCKNVAMATMYRGRFA